MTKVPDLPFNPKAVDRIIIPVAPAPAPIETFDAYRARTANVGDETEFQGFNQDVEEPDPRVPNVGDDPINPAYYDGTACAEIIEHMPTNVGIAAKYGWRLGEKDEEKQECGKAAWYLKRELALQEAGTNRGAFGFGWQDGPAWYRKYADERIDAARKAGKLTPERALFMTHLVSYTITGHVSLLHQAIGFLESPGCFNDYGNGLAI